MRTNYHLLGKIAGLVLLAVLSAFFLPQPSTINGIVKDAQSKLPIKGVTIKEIGTLQSIVSGADGRFTLKTNGQSISIKLSCIGYESQTVLVLQQNNEFEVLLKGDASALQEVIVTGYATKKMKASVDASAPMQILQGRAAGVMVRGLASESPQQSPYFNADESEFNTEEYAAIHENRFLAVAGNALSTFSIDVDAASYSNVRRFIQQGQLPPAGAVRTEELINYFDYQYAGPVNEDPFAIHTEILSCPWNQQHQLVSIGLQGKKIPMEHLPASNLVFLIDVSGSMMSENKLPLVKASLLLLADQLREQDKVSIVVYAGSAGLVLPPTNGSNKIRIKEALNALEAGGSTAGGEGIKLAYKTARENFVKNGNNRVILCSDGDFNVGESSDAAMELLIEKERESGVFLTVLGYGMGNYKDNKMEVLADKGNGNHAYIDGLDEAKKVLVHEFGGTLFTIAKDVKLQVEFNPAYVQAYRLIGYENRLLNKEDFNNDLKDAGDLGSGHTVTALYEIIPTGVKDRFTDSVDLLKYQRLPALRGTESNEVLQVKFRYKAPDGNSSKLIVRTVQKQDAVEWQQATVNAQFAAAVAEWGMILNNSSFRQQSSFEGILTLANGSLQQDVQGYRKSFIELVKKSQAIMQGKDISFAEE